MDSILLKKSSTGNSKNENKGCQKLFNRVTLDHSKLGPQGAKGEHWKDKNPRRRRT